MKAEGRQNLGAVLGGEQGAVTLDRLTGSICRAWDRSANGRAGSPPFPSALPPALPLTEKGVVCMHVGTPVLCLTSVHAPQLLFLGPHLQARGVAGLAGIDLGRGPWSPWK